MLETLLHIAVILVSHLLEYQLQLALRLIHLLQYIHLILRPANVRKIYVNKTNLLKCLCFHLALCRLLTSIPFGTVSQSGREPGDTATYSCNSGFELVGDPTRTCTVVGPGTAMFSGDEPSCRRMLSYRVV